MKEKIITKELLDSFKQRLIVDKKSNATVEKYCRDVNRFYQYAGSSAITKELVITYKQELLKQAYVISSINSMLASINNLFVFMGWNDCIVKSLKLQRAVFCPKEKELSKVEYVRLINAAKNKGNERLNLVIQTICATGMRVSELAYITVEAVRYGEVTVSCKAKTRSIFIVSELRKKLLKYAKRNNIQSGEIFITRTGKSLSRTNIWREMKSLCEQANVNPKKVFPHNLRHLFARTFYGIKKDITKLADILGHSNINTTRIYTISSGEEHRRYMEYMRLII